MAPGPDHAACVDTWLKRTSEKLSAETRLPLFEAAFAALWASARITLDEATLAAIAGRVLQDARARFPLLASLELAPRGGIICPDPGARARLAEDPGLEAGIRFLLVELLTVLGKLTAEILTPELHATLLQVDRPEPADRQDPPR